MSEELRETERLLFKLDENRKNNMVAIHDLEQTKERLLSFAEYAKDAQPEVMVTLIRSIVEQIYIVDRDDERYCHIFIKGCTGEDYTGFFQTAGYIEQNTAPVCDSEQDCICYMHLRRAFADVLPKDIHTPEASKPAEELLRLNQLLNIESELEALSPESEEKRTSYPRETASRDFWVMSRNILSDIPGSTFLEHPEYLGDYLPWNPLVKEFCR